MCLQAKNLLPKEQYFTIQILQTIWMTTIQTKISIFKMY